MESIGLRELTHHTSRIMDRVRRGETIQVTDHGRPVARICPASSTNPPADSLLETLAASGKAVPATDRTPFTMPLGAWDGIDSTDVVSDLREDRL